MVRIEKNLRGKPIPLEIHVVLSESSGVSSQYSTIKTTSTTGFFMIERFIVHLHYSALTVPCHIPYFSGYKPHFCLPQINHESGVRLIRGHRHLEVSSGYYRQVSPPPLTLHSIVIYRPSIQCNLMFSNVIFSENNFIYN